MPVFDPDQPNNHDKVPMKFQAKSEDQIARENCLEPGTYDFEVVDAHDKVSKKTGNEMIHLKLKVFRADGGFIFVDDYLLEQMAFKLIHFCAAAGIADKYNLGTLSAEDCKGRAGRVTLKIDVQEGYPPKNAVKDYVKPGAEPRQIAPGVTATTVHAPAAAPSQRPVAAAVAAEEEPPF